MRFAHHPPHKKPEGCRMTALERRLLNAMQKDFPLHVRPFRVMAQRLGISEKRCMSILNRLYKRGILRAIRPVVNWKCLGFSSVLVGMEVDPSKINAVVSMINREPGVTHNYLRDGPFNLWFTFTYEHERRKKSFIRTLRTLPGVVQCREFPSLAVYKIGLVLDV
jgi:DNA-binding Lrp family transcriptional regulator